MNPDDASTYQQGEAQTLRDLIERFEHDGYRGQFGAREGGVVRCFSCRRDFAATDMAVRTIRRTEGSSDPDDMLAVLPLTCPLCDTRDARAGVRAGSVTGGHRGAGRAPRTVAAANARHRAADLRSIGSCSGRFTSPLKWGLVLNPPGSDSAGFPSPTRNPRPNDAAPVHGSRGRVASAPRRNLTSASHSARAVPGSRGGSMRQISASKWECTQCDVELWIERGRRPHVLHRTMGGAQPERIVVVDGNIVHRCHPDADRAPHRRRARP